MYTLTGDCYIIPPPPSKGGGVFFFSEAVFSFASIEIIYGRISIILLVDGLMVLLVGGLALHGLCSGVGQYS